jgi:arylsulfatase A
LRRISPLAAILALLLASTPEAEGIPRPSFVLILVDDVGWNGTSVRMDAGDPGSRSDFYETPRLEQLAAAGMTFSRAYAPAAICAPTRYSMQTGMSPAQLRATRNAAAQQPLTVAGPSIPQVLEAIDPEYRAAHFGKWHMHPDPTALGYEQSDGRTDNETATHTGASQLVWQEAADPKRMFEVTARALDFIADCAAADEPFFVQVSHYANHLDVQATAESIAAAQGRAPGSVHASVGYAAMTADLDRAIGQLLDGIASLGIAEQTFVFLTSDNGAATEELPGVNHPLRDGKYSHYQGGLRVPLIVTGPGIAAGSRSDEPVIGWDLLPTIADLAGDASLVGPGVEGGSLRPLLESGAGPVARAREGLFFHRVGYGSALIRGGWKLTTDWRLEDVELYDLEADPGETSNLAASSPALAETLRREISDYLDAVDAERFHTFGPLPVEAFGGGAIPEDHGELDRLLEAGPFIARWMQGVERCWRRGLSAEARGAAFDVESCASGPRGARSHYSTAVERVRLRPPGLPACHDPAAIAAAIEPALRQIGAAIYCEGEAPSNLLEGARLPRDRRVLGALHRASKMTVRHLRDLERCYRDGIERIADGRDPELERCIEGRGGARDRYVVQMAKLATGPPGLPPCLDTAVSLDAMDGLLRQVIPLQYCEG